MNDDFSDKKSRAKNRVERDVKPAAGKQAAESGSESPDKPRRRRSRRGRSAAASIDYTVPSPCIAICEYNDAGLCKGCLRNADEIRDWIILSREQKLQVLDLVAERRLQLGND